MLTLPAIFGSYMILQRDKEIVLWGTTDAEKVTVELIKAVEYEIEMAVAGPVETMYEYDTVELVEATFTSDGCVDATKPNMGGKDATKPNTDSKKIRSWKAVLSPRQADGFNYNIKITTENDDDYIIYFHVLFGEVWLAGGQSNMEFEMQQVLDAENELNKIDDDNIRFYYTPKVGWIGQELEQAEKDSFWLLAKPYNCKKWSAIGYYFAKKIKEELGVPVGIIGCNWGGTSASCWTSRESREKEEKLASYLKEYDDAIKGIDEEAYNKKWAEYEVYQAEFDKRVKVYYETYPNPNWDEAIKICGENYYPGPMGPRNFTRPCGLYETMLKRVAPYTVRGFIFYQGEEDDHKPYTYDILLETLINQWRKDWNDAELPFLFMQLPVFVGESEGDYKNWAFVREAQMDVYKRVAHTGLAVALDQGIPIDIHPKYKIEVADRLAKQALYEVYGKLDRKAACGPMYKHSEFKDGAAFIELENAENGLSIHEADNKMLENDEYLMRNAVALSNLWMGENAPCIESGVMAEGATINEGAARGFEIAGEDKVYYPANAEIMGSVIMLTSDKVSNPKYARYCFTNYMRVNVFGENGLPLAPFRTSKDDGEKATGSRKGFVI